MARSRLRVRPFDIRESGLVDAILDWETMSLWECLRRLDRPVTAQELADAASLRIVDADRTLRRLESCGLIRRLRASGRRRSVGFVVAVPSIVIEFDRRDASQRATVERVVRYVDQRLEQDLFRAALPLERMTKHDWHYRHCSPITIDPDDLAELQLRIGRVEEFLQLLNNRYATHPSRAFERCNHAIAIRVAPLGRRVLPQPSIEFLARSPLAVERRTERQGLGPLSSRERSVALALRSGATRAEVAKRLGLSVLTVGTLCKRIYRKLGVRRAADLHRVLSD